MGKFVVLVSLILLISVSWSYAALQAPVQAYWEKVMPNSPMPAAIRDLIIDGNPLEDTAAAAVNAGKGGGHLSTSRGKTVYVSHGGVVVNTHKGGKPPVVVNVSPFYYTYAANDTQIHDDPRVALFFLEKDLRPGTKMTLNFKKTAPTAAFIPRTKATSIPFSSAKLPEILSRFAIDPKSPQAETMKRTIEECELPAMKGESKHCATSLEAMVEFSMKSLGTRNVKAVSTDVGKDGAEEREYTIKTSGIERVLRGDKMVACHLQEYAYAVFYCHATRRTRAYAVKLAADDGSGVEAVAVCHTDTAEWNPRHVAFRVLGVKPGTVPVCHFLPQDHLVWGLKD